MRTQLEHDENQKLNSQDNNIRGLFSRMPVDLQKTTRKIIDAPNYDFAAMEMLDALGIEWRGRK